MTYMLAVVAVCVLLAYGPIVVLKFMTKCSWKEAFEFAEWASRFMG